MLIFYVYHKVN